MRKRKRRRGRPCAKPKISWLPELKEIHSHPLTSKEYISLSHYELEALRLVDYEDLTCEEAAKKMHVSRTTVWRLVKSGRKKLLQSLIERKRIKIEK